MSNEKREKKLKSRLRERIKRVKVPKKEKSFIKKDHSKLVALAVWSLLVGILFICILTIFLSINTRSVLNDTKKVVHSRDETEEREEISIPSAEQFLTGFISQFINVKKTSEDLEKRKNELQSYMVQSEEFANESHSLYQMPDIQGERILNSYSLFNVKEKGDYTLFQYRVTFKNVVEKQKEVPVKKKGDKDKKGKNKTKIVTETDESSQTLLLNIPVVSSDEVFSVSGVPYFTKEYSLKGKIEKEGVKKHLNAYTGEEKEDIETFLVNFFEKYASEDKEELAYMMKEPHSLGGSFLFDELLNVEIYEDKSYFIAYAKVRFREEMTNIPYVISVEMKIVNKEGNYFVEKMDYQ
ncbi:conjugal transfer protein [Virgibacillus sp. AGTR]|uniref:conjugal transfer protein n=1 Tax=Virgibacillus sp. AGTR TaxID=2812055 RepID=UPI001D169CFF|nr:conjugal transfer protein [Virgibacillus sp. AGTR]MCC2251779.1 conjugal transfer protein [Virgibacillus sp. AGTR]